MPLGDSILRWLNEKSDLKPRRRVRPFPSVQPMEVRILLSATAADVGDTGLANDDVTPTDEVADQEGLEVIDDGATISEGNDKALSIDDITADALGIPVDDGVAVITEGWDPSWAYRSLTMSVGEGDASIAVEPFAGWEEGLDGIAPHGSVLVDCATSDFSADGMPVDAAMVVPVPDSPDGFDPMLPFLFGEDSLGGGVVSDGLVLGEMPTGDFNADGVPVDVAMGMSGSDSPDGFDPLLPFVFGEDGLGCGIAPDGFVPDDGATGDFNTDGVPVDFVVNHFGLLSPGMQSEADDATESNVDGNPDEFDIGPVRYLGGPVYRGGNESIDEVSNDFVLNLNDPLAIEVGGEVVDGEADSPNVIFYSFNAAAGAGSDAAPPEVDPATVSENVDTSILSGNNAGPSDLTGTGLLLADANQTIRVALPTNDPNGNDVGLIPNPTEVSGESDVDPLTQETSADSYVATSLPEGLADTAVVDVAAHVDSRVDAHL